MYPSYVFSGKQIYIVQDHASALIAWAKIRNELGSAPILLSLDHHVDTKAAFTHAIHVDGRSRDDPAEFYAVSSEYCKTVNFTDLTNVEQAVSRLRNDEHINAAVQSGIIDHAYVVPYMRPNFTFRKMLPNDEEFMEFIKMNPGRDAEELLDECPFAPYDDIPFNRIFELESECFPGCEGPHTAACRLKHSDSAIEADYLQRKLQIIEEMSSCIGIHDVISRPFILDIDLDYFHTKKAINPTHPEVFYEIIRRSHAITIATEPRFVEYEKLEETVTSEFLLPKLLEHIRKALE